MGEESRSQNSGFRMWGNLSADGRRWAQMKREGFRVRGSGGGGITNYELRIEVGDVGGEYEG